MTEFLQDLYRDLCMEDGFPLPQGLVIEFQAFRGTTLEGGDEMVGDVFERGEMVHAKVFTEDGDQCVLNYNQGRFTWELK
jgi:hypothetical protein